ncbi:MAG: branched-chain amino acid aminotransferase, partial [Planctomycetota bacterium]
MKVLVNLNGNICSQEQALISVFDHGFLFGDSVYEVVRTYEKRPFKLDEHVQRMESSAKRIHLSLNIDLEEWKTRIQNTLSHFDGDEAYIRLIVTRGVGEITLDPSVCPYPNHIIIVKPLES